MENSQCCLEDNYHNYLKELFIFDIDSLKVDTGYKKCNEICDSKKEESEEGELNEYCDQLEIRDELLDKVESKYKDLLSYSLTIIKKLESQIKRLEHKKKKLKKSNLKLKKSGEKKERNSPIFNDPSENVTFDLDKKLKLDSPSQSNNEQTVENEENPIQVPVEDKWKSNDIAKEVEELANEVLQTSNFVYYEELQMYYDTASGYYYDPKTSLYYESNSKTYFYYDHDSQSYQFHSYAESQEKIKDESDEENASNTDPTASSGLEEGQDLDSSENAQSKNLMSTQINNPKADYSSEPDVAPCLRLMVTNGEEKGNLHVVTLTGGKIGKDSKSEVLLSDQTVSKVHAEVIYRSGGSFDHHYFLRDLGSNNGTFVRDKRLCESREKSELVEIGHGWNIAVGEVNLTCHIHPGYLTCNTCEPGLLPQKEKKKVVVGEAKEKVRRRVNKSLKKKYILQESGQLPQGYKNRALERRVTVGSDNPYEKTEMASIDESISDSNKGFKLMEKMGWSQGQGLGAKQDGIVQPVVPHAPSFDRTGLGVVSFSIGISKTSKKISSPPPISDKTKIPMIQFQPASSSPNDT